MPVPKEKLYKLPSDKVFFPDPRDYSTPPYGEFALGGQLTPEWLVVAYSRGIFPFYAFRFEKLKWCCPMDRFVIFPEEIHVSHSMRNLINKGQYEVTLNAAFEYVIQCCSELREDQLFAWLGKDMIKAYTELHEKGFASSVEVWDGDYLVGGLYGVHLGNCFFGESMFSLVPSASKLALIALAKSMQGQGGFIDCQYETDHLLTMGGRHITYDEYMEILKKQIIPVL